MTKKSIIEFGPYSHHVSVAIEAAKQAGGLIRNNSNLNASLSGLEFKAEVDELAGKVIISKVQQNFPQDAILTEETGFPKQESERLWVVDPLDGTTNFLNGLRMYSSLISYVENGKPVVSVACLPRSNEVLIAVTGFGVFINNRKIKLPKKQRKLRQANIALDPGYDPEGGRKISEAFNKLRPNVGNVVMFNGNGYTLSLMALGEVAGFVHFASKIWEVAGLHIVLETGGMVTDLDGRPLQLDFRQPSVFQFVASRGIDHNELLQAIK